MTRPKLFTLRLAVSAATLVVLTAVVLGLWYPGGYAHLFGVPRLLLILALGVLVVGPGLSTLVYRPGKRGLKSDLLIIAALELLIVAWAGLELYAQRPSYAVFAVDRFEAVGVRDIDAATITDPLLRRRPGFGPRLVYAQLPDDPDVMSRLIDETVFYGQADIDRRPEFWASYESGIAAIKAAARPLPTAVADARGEQLRNWLQRRELHAKDYLYLPIRGRRNDGLLLLHADIGFPVAVLAIDPW